MKVETEGGGREGGGVKVEREGGGREEWRGGEREAVIWSVIHVFL